MTEEKDLICSVCGAGPFRTTSGLAGHKQIAHNVLSKTIKTNSDEISKRLKAVESYIGELRKSIMQTAMIIKKQQDIDQRMFKTATINSEKIMKFVKSLDQITPHIILDGTLEKHLIKLGVVKKKKEKVKYSGKF